MKYNHVSTFTSVNSIDCDGNVLLKKYLNIEMKNT